MFAHFASVSWLPTAGGRMDCVKIRRPAVGIPSRKCHPLDYRRWFGLPRAVNGRRFRVGGRVRVVAGANGGRTSRLDIGFGVAAGWVTVVVGCFVASWLYPPGAGADRLLVLAVFIGAFAAVVRDALAALVTAGLAWPFYLGFLVDRYGELRWHGGVDLLRLAVLVVASLIGAALGRRVPGGRSARAGREALVPATDTWIGHAPMRTTAACREGTARHGGERPASATAVPGRAGRGVEGHG